MSKKILILTIPGIGSQKKGYAEKFRKDVRKYTSPEVSLSLDFIETLPFQMAGTDVNQEMLYDRLQAQNNVGGKLKKFVMDAFGDGVTFERNASYEHSVYKKIHRYLRDQIEHANSLLKEGDHLVIVVSSMGAQLLSTYIWDADKGSGIFESAPATNNQNLENLSYLASVGCNIPLFVSGVSKNQIVAFKKRNTNFEWDNYFDKNDVLGWPLKQMSDSYNDLVNDHDIKTGWSIGSHIKYWEDNAFTKPFSEKMDALYGL